MAVHKDEDMDHDISDEEMDQDEQEEQGVEEGRKKVILQYF